MPVYFLITAFLFLSLGAVYFFIILKYINGWELLKEWQLPDDFIPSTKVTVIVPARNEEENIINCLISILKNNYPQELLEIIVVDDHSTDNTFSKANLFAKKNATVKILKLADYVKENSINSFKKSAIEMAIKNSTGELIVTTDADCLVPPDWLLLMISFYQKNKMEFIAAPVNFHHEKSFFEKFQSLDFIGMMGVTGAGIQLRWMNMCNGANLAYSKKIFEEVNGFEGVGQMASGDDILLMQKIVNRFPGKIGFLKNRNATVLTKAKKTVKSFISQRLRWATKSTSYKEWKITFILSIVFFYCSAILFSFFAFFIDGLKWWVLLSFLVLIKSILDFFFLKKMTDYFNRSDLMKNYFGSQVFHILYIVLIGLLSNLKKQYVWKGRKVK